MRRSGKLLVTLLCAAALAACTVSAPEPTAPPDGANACPPGLADALEAHLLTQPLGDVMPSDATVTENSETMTFASDLVASLVGCTMVLETIYNGGDTMGQMFGIAEGLDETEVIAAFEAAGWAQLFPETDPGVWGTADQSEGARIFTAESDIAMFGFDRWSEYLAPDVVMIASGIAF